MSFGRVSGPPGQFRHDHQQRRGFHFTFDFFSFDYVLHGGHDFDGFGDLFKSVAPFGTVCLTAYTGGWWRFVSVGRFRCTGCSSRGSDGYVGVDQIAMFVKELGPVVFDFAKHAEAMGALAKHCESLSDLENAMEWAQTTDRTTVISINSDAYSWTPGGADWYVGVPEINDRQSIREAREGQEAFRKKQRQGI